MAIQTANVLIGCDPELFVSKGGKVSSAIGKIGGSKDEPLLVPRGNLQEDNVLLEFGIDPAASLEAFKESLSVVLGEAKGALKKHKLDLVEGLCAHVYEGVELRRFGPNAFVFGCEPDFNAWNGGKENPRPSSEIMGLRTAGGHIHLGYDNPSREQNLEVVKMFGYTLGLPSVVLDTTRGSALRKELYGKSGAFRHKPYGVECRELSNFWLFSEELQEWAFTSARKCVTEVGMLGYYERALPPSELQRIVNGNLVEEAREWCYQLELLA